MDSPAKEIKIGLVCAEDPRDVRSWSGTLNSIYQKLEERYQVTIVVPSAPLWLMVCLKLFGWAIKALTGKYYDRGHSLLVSGVIAKKTQSMLRDLDIVVAPAASTQIASLKVSQPIIYLSDSTFPQLENYYQAFARIWPKSKKEARKVEMRAVSNASHLIFSSSWAANFTAKYYKKSSKSISVIPFGSNLPDEFEGVKSRESDETFHILFVGVKWERKGGDIVLRAFEELLARNHNVHLTICGSRPPRQLEQMTVYPFLDKQNPSDLEKIKKLFLHSHLLFLPTRADCTPIVFCEAAMYGLPILSTKTGGVPSLVVDDKNGYCLEVDSSTKDYADKIEILLKDEHQRLKMAFNSREMYERTLNWDHWLEQMKQVIMNLAKTN